MEVAREERTLADLVTNLTRDTALLVRQEVQLAKAELGETLARATRDAVSLAGAGLVAGVAALALAATIVLVLVQIAGVPAWLATLLVAAVLGVTAVALIVAALRDLRRIGPPERTVKTIRDDIEWAKHQP
jgi:uncharacterized membrane protein YqjE